MRTSFSLTRAVDLWMQSEAGEGHEISGGRNTKMVPLYPLKTNEKKPEPKEVLTVTG